MAKIIVAIVLVLLAIYIVPFVVYGTASAFGGLQLPASASPSRFLLGVLVTKLGTAAALVLIFAGSRAAWNPRWRLYALLWFVMFALSELGEAISGGTTSLEAALGILSEAIYAPIAVIITKGLLGRDAA